MCGASTSASPSRFGPRHRRSPTQTQSPSSSRQSLIQPEDKIPSQVAEEDAGADQIAPRWKMKLPDHQHGQPAEE